MFYKHVDVFSKIPFSGNSLSVFFPTSMLETSYMQKIAEEMRHFESIFLYPTKFHNEYQARIFTMEEELDFAGHPIIGAACAIHDKYYKNKKASSIKLNLNNKTVSIETIKQNKYYSATMNQGMPEFISQIPKNEINNLIKHFNLTSKNMADLPLEVVSTGLSYLIVPLISGLDKVCHKNISPLLAKYQAQFVYFYDILKQTGRTWDNNGSVEDIATGSAAGPLVAYLVKYHRAMINEKIIINQGTFLGRPSEMTVKPVGANNSIKHIEVSGDCSIIGFGNITQKLL